jgi:hypothetical protein
MVDDYMTEKLIKKHAKEQGYTLVANSYGSLSYVKYIKGEMTIMKWHKGANDINITTKDKTEKIPISNLTG